MKWNTVLRAFGIAGIVLALGVFGAYDLSIEAFMIAAVSVIALVSPEALDQLPFGPSK
jgi:hypothetical protein